MLARGEGRREGGRGERGLGRGANTILAWPGLIHHPEGEGAESQAGLHPQHTPCTQHYQNIDLNIKTQERMLQTISRLSLSHTRRVVTPVLHLAGARPSPLRVRAAPEPGHRGNWEIGNLCDVWPGRPLACPAVTNTLQDTDSSSSSLSLSPPTSNLDNYV